MGSQTWSGHSQPQAYHLAPEGGAVGGGHCRPPALEPCTIFNTGKALQVSLLSPPLSPGPPGPMFELSLGTQQ